MQFYARYTSENSPDRVFEIEPAFHLAFFRSRFSRYKQAVIEAISPTFHHLENLLGAPIDRDAFAELLVRNQLSTLLVPASDEWKQLWNDTADNVQKWALSISKARA